MKYVWIVSDFFSPKHLCFSNTSNNGHFVFLFLINTINEQKAFSGKSIKCHIFTHITYVMMIVKEKEGEIFDACASNEMKNGVSCCGGKKCKNFPRVRLSVSVSVSVSTLLKLFTFFTRSMQLGFFVYLHAKVIFTFTENVLFTFC